VSWQSCRARDDQIDAIGIKYVSLVQSMLSLFGCVEMTCTLLPLFHYSSCAIDRGDSHLTHL
jgi:hypothetical protein